MYLLHRLGWNFSLLLLKCVLGTPTFSSKHLHKTINCVEPQPIEMEMKISSSLFQNSPLFEVLANQTPPSGSSMQGEDNPPPSHISLLMSPAKVKRDQPAVENGRPPRYKTLDVFRNKVCRLAYSRLWKIVAKLELHKDLVWPSCSMSQYSRVLVCDT